MKAKKVVAMLLAGATLTMTTAAFAEVNFSGDVSVKYEKDTADNEPDLSGNVTTLKVLGEADLGSNWTFYTRLGAQHVSKVGLGDFKDSQAYDPDKKTVISLDQFGFVYTDKEFTYKFGRQDAAVGNTALLYSRADSNIGRHNFVDGLTAAGKSGVVDLSAVIAKEDNVSEIADNRIYAVRAGYSPSEKFNYGVTLGRFQSKDSSLASTNHWAVDGTYTLEKSSLTAEYTKSNSDTENKAYATTLNYDFDGKTAAYVTAFRVEANGDMGGQTDFENNARGSYFGVTHQLSDAYNVELVYKKWKEIGSTNKSTSLEATVTYSF